MDVTAACFAVGSIIAFLVSFFGEPDDRGSWEYGVISTGVLVTYWGINNIIYLIFPLWVYLVTDFLFSLFYIYLARLGHRWFLIALAPMMASNVVFDLLFLTGWMPYGTMMTIENWIMAAMLIVSCGRGIWPFVRAMARGCRNIFLFQVWLVFFPITWFCGRMGFKLTNWKPSVSLYDEQEEIDFGNAERGWLLSGSR